MRSSLSTSSSKKTSSIHIIIGVLAKGAEMLYAMPSPFEVVKGILTNALIFVSAPLC